MPKKLQKKLLFQSHTHNFFGGGEFSLRAIMKESLNKGYDVHVIVPGHGDFEIKAREIGATVHIIKSYWWTYNGRNEFMPKQNKKAIKRTQELLDTLMPDFCISNTIATPWLAYAASKKNIPHIWILREYGDVDHGLKFWLPMKQIGTIISDLSAKIFVNSEILQKHYKKLCNRKDIDIIYPSVETPQVTTKKSPFNTKGIKLVCVGNLSSGKGQLDAVKATKELIQAGHDAQLLLIGLAAEEDYEQKIKSYIVKNNLQEYVILKGYQNNPANYVAFADINLVCSKSETFGRVTVESILLGTPVIGTNAGNTKILLQDNPLFLYKFNDSNELSKKIIKLCQNKDSTKIVKLLQQSIKARYSPHRAHDDFFHYLNKAPAKIATKKDIIFGITNTLDKQQTRSKSRILLNKIRAAIRS